ncbi:ATP-binding protein [Loktanella sp. Alg231-35]|uniref:ATP-binding protein n=1 Tax=Loktanella sp. Alg231-35 TaxID=1922220 RepID=UPI000D55C49A|nr:HAMP domain-containing sensor histidine kinase [Loktanella sp. Alg231-35]
MTSLRTRAVTGGILLAVVTIVLALAGLGSFMNAQTQTRFTDLLRNRHSQAIVAAASYLDRPDKLGRTLGDPAYQRPFSGEYWQIQSPEGAVYRSPSLVKAALPAPTGSSTERRSIEYVGPTGNLVVGISQWIILDDGSRWHVQVASSLDQLEAELDAVRQSLLSAFAIVAFVGVLGALAQVAMILQPLNALRKDVSARWEGENGLEVESYPVEVAPLVTDINGLMDRNRDIIRRSRRQAADLAHAIKTPSAIMRNELGALENKGMPVQDALEALDRLDAQLKRSFARMRADGGENAVGVFTDLDAALGRMQRAFSALARNAEKEFSADYEPDLRVRMDQSDFEEVMGNLLDNALKWSEGRVLLTAKRSDDNSVIIMVADDGPGIPQEEIAQVTRSGHRLDVSKPGTGLGLAIASDLINAYGGDILLSRSEVLGGLSAVVRLPSSGSSSLDHG